VFGAPGAGARTQAAVLAERFDVAHLEAPALLASWSEGGDRPRAGIGRVLRPAVSDEAVVRLVMPRLQAATDAGGWVLSGFPRTVPQAALLTKAAAGQALDVEVAVRLDVPRRELTDRLVRRGTTGRHRGVRTAHPPGDRMELGPLSGFYARSARLLTIDGSGTVGQVASDLLRGLHIWRLDLRLAARAHRDLAASAVGAKRRVSAAVEEEWTSGQLPVVLRPHGGSS
jgi:adenylate kinase